MTSPNHELNEQIDKLFYFLKSRGSLIIIIFLVVAVPLTIAAISKPQRYTAVAKIMFENNRRLSLELSSQLSERAARSTIAIERLNSQIEILKGNMLAEQTVQFLGMAKYPDEEPKIIRRVQQNIEAYLMPESTIIEISYTDTDPALARNFLNALINLYKDYYSKNIEGENVFAFYDDRVKQIKSELDNSISELNALRAKEAIYADIDTVQNDIFKNVQASKARLATADLRIAEIKGQIMAIRKQLYAQPKQISNSIEMVANPEMMAIKNQIAALEVEKANLLTKYVDGAREVTDIDKQISVLKDGIEAYEPSVEGKRTVVLNPVYENLRNLEMNLSSELDGLMKSRFAVVQMIESDEGRLEHLEAIEYQFITAEHKVAVGKKMHGFYLSKLDDARFVEAMNNREITSINVIQSAELKQTQRLATLSSAAAGTGLGAVVALICALLVELFRPRLTRPDQIQDVLGVPVVGSISNGHNGK